jgi:lipoate-protein ligase A
MKFVKSAWRLLKTQPSDGPWNMAVDEAILEAVGLGQSPPTLRLFAWEPPCLSIGYAQSIQVVDEGCLRAKGWDIVRRSTGGGAILHTDELTYSVIGPSDEPRLKGDILTSYRRLSEAISLALENLGLPVETRSHEKLSQDIPPEPVCFEIPSHYEITVGGKKLVGSAQARKKNVMLQHGTLPLYGDLTRITEVLVYPDEQARVKAAERLITRAATVESVLGRIMTWEEAAEVFISAFEGVLNLELGTSELTAQEETRARELVVEKFGNDAWTKRL